MSVEHAQSTHQIICFFHSLVFFFFSFVIFPPPEAWKAARYWRRWKTMPRTIVKPMNKVTASCVIWRIGRWDCTWSIRKSTAIQESGPVLCGNLINHQIALYVLGLNTTEQKTIPSSPSIGNSKGNQPTLSRGLVNNRSCSFGAVDSLDGLARESDSRIETLKWVHAVQDFTTGPTNHIIGAVEGLSYQRSSTIPGCLIP